jgi:hypothetical protein
VSRRVGNAHITWLLERRFSIKNLTPQPPSLPGKGEVDSPLKSRRGAGGEVVPGLVNRCSRVCLQSRKSCVAALALVPMCMPHTELQSSVEFNEPQSVLQYAPGKRNRELYV